MQHDFSLGTVNISGWHRVRKIQKCIFLAFWVILSEMHSNGYKKCWCKLQNFVKENQVVLKLDHNPIILSWKNTAKEWVSLLLSHQSVMRKYLHMWKEARTVDRAIQSKGTVFSLLPPSKVHLKKKKSILSCFLICFIDFDPLSFASPEFFLQLWKTNNRKREVLQILYSY